MSNHQVNHQTYQQIAIKKPLENSRKKIVQAAVSESFSILEPMARAVLRDW